MSPHISDTQFCILHSAFCIISRCGAVGDVSERTLWVIKRGISSGSRRRTRALAMRDALTATGSARIITKNQISRCGAIGSALALGAGHRLHSPRKQKTPKALVNTDFFGTLLSRKILNKSGLTTCLTTYGKTSKIQYFLPFGVWRSW